MPFNLDQSNVAPGPVFDPVLEDLQANILKFHGRKFAYHLFFKLDKAKKEMARTWIKTFAASITSAKKQLVNSKDVREKRIADGGTILTLSLSAKGYDAIGKANVKPDDASFLHGLKGSADRLKDHPDLWEEPFKNEVDMLIIVADAANDVALKKANDIIHQVASFALLLLSQRGNVLKLENGVGIEHFGYADGVSQPMYLEDEIKKQGVVKEWNDQTNLSLLLVSDKGGKSPGETSFGSYMVFRKLEQHVKDFKDAEGDSGPKLSKLPQVLNEKGVFNPELPGAMIVGRFESGTPVVRSSEEEDSDNPTNDFDYRDDPGLKCPYHAHIRLVNPRNGDTLAKDYDLRPHRITRRGIPFDDNPAGSKRIEDDKITHLDDDLLGNLEGQKKQRLGLLFMCYQSNIIKQFEVLQGDFANQGLTPYAPVKGQDSIITQGTDLPRHLTVQWNKPMHTENFQFSGFVKMKGGEYFFTPSISFLMNL